MSLSWLIIVFVVIFQNAAVRIKNYGQKHLEDNRHFIPVCTTPGCVKAAATVLHNMDPTADPCEDFYKFACGGFVNKTTIPDDKSIVISFNMIGDRVDEQLKTILEEPLTNQESKPFILLKKLYHVCMNTDTIEEDGLETIKNLIREVGGWPLLDGNTGHCEFDWKTTLFQFRKAGIPTYSFFTMYVSIDTKNATKRIINLDQAMLGLEREYLMEGFVNDMVKAYYEYLVDIAVLFNADREAAEIEMKKVVEFEMDLARISLPKEERRNISSLYNPMTVAELQTNFPDLIWLEFLNKMVGVPEVWIRLGDVVNVGVPRYFEDLFKLLDATDKRTQANFLITQAVIELVACLTKELRNRELKFKEISDGTKAMKPRWKECVDAASSGLKIAASALYIRRYFNEDAKRKAKVLVGDLQNTFRDILHEVEWMDDETRAEAIAKLDAMVMLIAYPKELLNDAKLEEYYAELQPSDNYLLYALKIRKFVEDLSYKKLREPVERTDWTKRSSSARVNAYYSNLENSIQIPAGILQGVFFDHDRPNYMNYGGIGYVIGHEITHGFDDIGRQFNRKGELEEWWAERTRKAFMNKAQCIIDQYGNYTISATNTKLNGINTQGENIADNGGLKEAYRAYNTWVTRNGQEPMLPGLVYNAKQMFWISSANLWCSKERKEYLRQHVTSDTHSPSYFRVIGSFSNSEDFAKDFKCAPGTPMNPRRKCYVW